VNLTQGVVAEAVHSRVEIHSVSEEATGASDRRSVHRIHGAGA